VVLSEWHAHLRWITARLSYRWISFEGPGQVDYFKGIRSLPLCSSRVNRVSLAILHAFSASRPSRVTLELRTNAGAGQGLSG
jgi:hypothetical protein